MKIFKVITAHYIMELEKQNSRPNLVDKEFFLSKGGTESKQELWDFGIIFMGMNSIQGKVKKVKSILFSPYKLESVHVSFRINVDM